MNARTFGLACVVVGALALLILSTPEVVQQLSGYQSWTEYLDARGRTLPVGLAATTQSAVSVRLNVPQEYDFAARAAILAARREEVARYPALAPLHYTPSTAVFGQIIDALPWWGLHGIYFFGPGSRSIEGPSEESRFLGNPYLLIGLLEDRAWVTQLSPATYTGYYPEPESLTYLPAERRIEITYRVAGYLHHLAQNRYRGAKNKVVSLAAYNARDFGFRFLSADSADSSNVQLSPALDAPIQILQFIHQGASCGFPGGCNNMSPYQPEFDLEVVKLPARLALRLWRSLPAVGSEEPDLRVIISLH